jgi:hypothetical protein
MGDAVRVNGEQQDDVAIVMCRSAQLAASWNNGR